MGKKYGSFLLLFLLVTAGTFLPSGALAHCDAKNGPVAEDARQALDSGNFETVAIWVGEEETEELRNKFDQSLEVYRLGGDAKELAEQYFMENAVRLHRAAEGFAYTGLKPAQPLPEDIAVAEKSLETGDLAPVTELLATEMQNETEKWFEKAREARKRKGESLEAGRDWADAYVKYVIFVHGLHKKISAGPEHGVGE